MACKLQRQPDGSLQGPIGQTVKIGLRSDQPASIRIHVAQCRVSIPLGSSGVSFPAAVSDASRSELVNGRSFWQDTWGVSDDFSSLKELVR